MAKWLKVLFLCMVVNQAVGQQQFTEAEKEVYDVIIKLFDGMRAGDSSMVSETFLSGAQMYTAISDTEGNPVLHQGSLDKFLEVVGSPHDMVLDEPIWNTEIMIDDNLAQVWTDYAFYAGKNFSHCGVDAFQLFKTNKGWKIFHITDTRKKEGCEIPEDIRKKRQE